MFDYAGAFGPKHWRSRLARRQAERWVRDIVEDIRVGRLTPPHDTAAYVIATHEDLDGRLLSPQIAAVELINVLRPTVAVSVFITFAIHALHFNPQSRQRVESGDADDLEHFAQEVRRFYPFFPAVAARVRHDFEWEGYKFHEGTRAILDLYGTNHDPRVWEQPDAFRPERFDRWKANAFSFIPQGGGDHHAQHRCPGEAIAVELIKVALRNLVREASYSVPEQDLSIDMSRLPALPRSRLVLSKVREKV